MPLDVALSLLLMADPQYFYTGSVTANSEESYDLIAWEDERPKPTWEQINTWWQNNQSLVAPYFGEN